MRRLNWSKIDRAVREGSEGGEAHRSPILPGAQGRRRAAEGTLVSPLSLHLPLEWVGAMHGR